MAEKILLIAPRWMPRTMIVRLIEQKRILHPAAQLELLADSSLKDTLLCVKFWELPSGGIGSAQHGAMLKRLWLALRQLRHQHYDQVRVLTDSGRGEVGYGEAKLWAFAARARQRLYNDEALTLWREVRAKRHATGALSARGVVALMDFLSPSLRGAQRHDNIAAWRSAVTFTYLKARAASAPNRTGVCAAMWRMGRGDSAALRLAVSKVHAGIVSATKNKRAL